MSVRSDGESSNDNTIGQELLTALHKFEIFLVRSDCVIEV
jgi:hypothetical protein